MILFPHRRVLPLFLYNIPVSRIPLPVMPSSLQGMLRIFSLLLCFLFPALCLQGCMSVLTVPENAHGLFLSLFLEILSHIVSLSQGIFLPASYLHPLLLPLFYILLDILYDTLLYSHSLVYVFSGSSSHYTRNLNRSKLRGIKPDASQ